MTTIETGESVALCEGLITTSTLSKATKIKAKGRKFPAVNPAAHEK
jgi:hypothetical protein